MVRILLICTDGHMADMGVLANDLALVNSYQKLARDYGLFVEKVAVQQPGDERKEYLVFSLSPIKSNVNPVAIINRNKRNTNIFYPGDFAVELHSENPLLMWERISNYMGSAEFMYDIYEQFDTPLPKAIRVDELNALANFYCKVISPDFDEETKNDYRKGLREFFKNENPKSKFKKDWQEFYRSELFDPNKSFVQNFFIFLNRHEPEVDLSTLTESSDDLKKVYMSEHYYKEFREIIKKRHPEVKYSVSEIRTVDNGLIVDPVSGAAAETPFGKTVTEEEYDRVMEERFDAEGYSCLDGLTPSFFEGRDIIYKASDENIVASISHEIGLRWARCCDLETLKQKGPLSSVSIPAGHLQNFYLSMKKEGVPIFFDYNENNNPNFETVKVVYNAHNENIVHNILVGLTMAQVGMAHMSLNSESIVFDVDVQKVDALIQQAKAKAIASTQAGKPVARGMLENSQSFRSN